MCSMPWRQVSILNENKEKTPQLQYECDVFSCHGRGNPAPSNFRLDAHAHKLGRILLHEFAVPFRPLVAGGIVRHENNVAVLIHLFLPPSVPLSPASLPVRRNCSKFSAWIVPFQENVHIVIKRFSAGRNPARIRNPLVGYLALQSRSLFAEI